MLKLSQVLNPPAPKITVKLHNGVELEIERHAFTREFADSLHELEPFEKETVRTYKTRQLLMAIKAWDVVDERGEPVPPSLEIFDQLDMRDINTIDDAIAGDVNPPRRAVRS